MSGAAQMASAAQANNMGGFPMLAKDNNHSQAKNNNNM